MSRAQAAQHLTHFPCQSRPGFSWRVGFFLASVLMCAFTAVSGDISVSGIAQKEVRRREALVKDAGARLDEADALLRGGKSEEAVNAYSQVYQSLPKAALAEPARNRARAGFAAASCQRARELMAEARYAEAAQLLDNVLAPDVDPDHPEARTLKKDF